MFAWVVLTSTLTITSACRVVKPSQKSKPQHKFRPQTLKAAVSKIWRFQKERESRDRSGLKSKWAHTKFILQCYNTRSCTYGLQTGSQRVHNRGPCFQTIEVMPTVVLQETHHGVGVEEEAPACFGHARLEQVCLGHACREVILEVSDGGTQLCRQQHKMGEETLTYRLIFLRGMMYDKQLSF